MSADSHKPQTCGHSQKYYAHVDGWSGCALCHIKQQAGIIELLEAELHGHLEDHHPIEEPAGHEPA